jgi:trimethylamine--corrinoid protein Co-methyltransferase
MIPDFKLLSEESIDRILGEAHQLLLQTGVRVSDPEARALLEKAGAKIENGVAFIPEPTITRSLSTVGNDFSLHTRDGDPAVHFSLGNDVCFDPGSCAVNILDPDTGQHRPALTADLVRLVQVTEMLPQFAAQSTAVVCHDAPPEIGDIYRLYIVLTHSEKPVVTGAFSSRNIQAMIDLLAADAGCPEALRKKPRAIFDVCPSPPMHWTEFACRCLIELGRAGVPVELVSMPLAGATAPVTLAGSLVQHAAESLAGLTIHQLAAPGAPLVWGGAPAIFDMRTGSAPMGTVETAMLDAGYATIGKRLGLPTHGYLGGSDSKLVDSQSGAEAATGFLVGALAGINMISGAGMLDSLNCQSVEKLVLDAEAIASAQRLRVGIGLPAGSLALESFAQAGLAGDFLKLRETRDLFQKEQHLPSEAIDRVSLQAWQTAGSPEAFTRARMHADALVQHYRKPDLPVETLTKFERVLLSISKP